MTKMVYPALMALVFGINGCDSSSNSNTDTLSSTSAQTQSSTASLQESSSSSSQSLMSSSLSSSLSSSSQASETEVKIITQADRGVVDLNGLVRANTLFDSDLYHGLKSEGENLFYSPFSIFSALSMTYAGAQNTTKSEFESVLHYEENLSVHESFAQLSALGAPEHNIFNVANSLWPQEGYPFKADFIYTVQQAYDSNVTYQNYIDDPKTACDTINDWVEEKTQDKIVDLIPSLDSTTRLVLVNAVYFKGTWEVSFDKNNTDTQPFYLTDGTQSSVDMMHLGGEYLAYYENETFQMLALPYKENEFSMLVFLPRETASMAELEAMLVQNPPQYFSSSAGEYKVNVSLPKFKIKWGTFDLTDFLKAQGMINTFDRNMADFSRMYDAQESLENIYIKAVYHQAFIEVNEEGAEAAAATAVVAVGISGTSVSEPKVFNADRPFIFYIIDNRSQMILFGGKLERP